MDPSSERTSYRGTSLQSATTQIRLLQLHPVVSEEDSDPVNGHLLCTELEHAPPYEALSYHWGNASIRKKIKLDGQDVEVQENLESALRHLTRSRETRLLWVDALCINQADLRERNAQVGIMHQIYQRASRTMAWIGDGGDDGEFAIEFLRWYAGRKLLMHPSDVDGRHREYEAQGWSAVEKLLQRPYWRRLWVMQEIALSSAAPCVVCGRARLGWQNLVAAVGDAPSAYYARCLHRIRGATAKLIRNGMSDNPKRIGRHVIFLLSHSAGFGTTEPRDRAYALYGLFKVVGIDGFTPDYSISVSRVYQKLTEFALAMKAGLDVLELRPHDQDSTLPSWVVDLSKRPPLSFAGKVENSWQRPEVKDLDAMGSYGQPDSFPVCDAQTLRVSGAVVDRVMSLGPVDACVVGIFRDAIDRGGLRIFGGESLRSDSTEASQYWAQYHSLQHPSGLCRNTIRYLSQWQSIVSYFCDNGTRSNDWYPRSWDWKQMEREVPTCPLETSQPLYNPGGQETSYSTRTSQSFDMKYRDALNPLLYSLSIMMQGRTCFETDTGLHGVSLAGIQEGDIIIAVQSTKHLHVLRPSNSVPGQHRYIGAAIVCVPTHEGKSSQRLKELLVQVKDNPLQDEVFIVH